MKYLQLQHTGDHTISVPVMGYGAMAISAFYDTNSDLAPAKEALKTALARGMSLIDTADFYGPLDDPEHNLRFLHDFLAELSDAERKNVILSVKSCVDLAKHKIITSPEEIQANVDNCLSKLGVDHLDIFYPARIPGNISEDALTAMAEKLKALKDSGQVHAIGLSEVPPKVIRAIHAICPVSVLQTEYSLMCRNPEINGILDTCRELGITFMSYAPLWRGGLTTGFNPKALAETDFRKDGCTTYVGDNWKHNQTILQALTGIARKKDCTLAQLALAWVTQQPGVISIVGTRQASRVAENMKALEIELTSTEMNEIRSVAGIGAPKGERYQAFLMDIWGLANDTKAPSSATTAFSVSPPPLETGKSAEETGNALNLTH